MKMFQLPLNKSHSIETNSRSEGTGRALFNYGLTTFSTVFVLEKNLFQFYNIKEYSVFQCHQLSLKTAKY